MDQKTLPEKTKSIEKRTTNTQACKQTQAGPPGRLKWVGGALEGITIYLVFNQSIYFRNRAIRSAQGTGVVDIQALNLDI